MRSMLHMLGFLRRVTTSMNSFASLMSFFLRFITCKTAASATKKPANLCAPIQNSPYSPSAKFSPENASKLSPKISAQTRQNL